MTWQCTNEMRWLETVDVTWCINGTESGRPLFTLQQKWFSNTGE